MNMEKKFILSRNGIDVLCRQTEPDFGDIRRIVLGVHGIGGSSVDAIQSGIAEEMELFYSATLRFDLPCHAESPVEDFTVANCVSSLLAVASWLKNAARNHRMLIFPMVFMILVTLSSLFLTFKGKLAAIAAGQGDMFAAYLQAGLAAVLFVLSIFLVREALPVLRGTKTK